MANMKLNIQRFDEQGAFDPSTYNSMINDFDSHVESVQQRFEANEDAIRFFKEVAGARKLYDITSPSIELLNNFIDEIVNYVQSVKRWGEGVVQLASGLGTSVDSIQANISGAVLENIEESYNGNYVGLQDEAAVDRFADDINDLISGLRNDLEAMSADISAADGALPEMIHQNLSTTISNNNEEIASSYSQISNYLVENLEEFKSSLFTAIEDIASAAQAGN